MPARLDPGTFTKAIYPERTVPGYASPLGARARSKAGDGAAELTFNIPTPLGSTLLMGDWNADGASTPIVYTNGQWVRYDTVVGSAPGTTSTFAFGAPGDKPVVGDWNGDGKTDIGVVRGNLWLLRNHVSAGASNKRFVYGLPTDVPITGDWDGDRRDGVGIVRAGTFFLRNATARKAALAAKTAVTFAFGGPTDTPVAGDWDGDGVDTVGAVRGPRWYLRNTNDDAKAQAAKAAKAASAAAKAAGKPSPKKPTKPAPLPKIKTDVKRFVNRPVDATPATWRTLAGPTGSACPTAARAVGTFATAKLVKPSLLLDKGGPVNPAVDPTGYTMRVALINAEKYLLNSQYQARWFSRRGQRFVDVVERATDPERLEKSVRLPAMSALTVAVATRTKAHHDPSVGRTTDEAVAYADFLVRSLACSHRAVSPGGWGQVWQSAHWAQMAGEAGWLLWDKITPQTREYVARMVVSEADFLLTLSTAYWADKAGTIVAPGNTKAEEDSWNAALLELAVNMMPTHPRAAAWRAKAVDLEVASYSTRADLGNAAPVNGIPVATRLQGANAYDDHTVENHGRIHPDYMTNIQHLWWTADFARLAGRAVPEAAFANGAATYGAFTTLSFPAGGPAPIGLPYNAPGGTIYQPGVAYPNDLYFPQFSDWGVGRRAPFISFDAHASAYALDSSAAVKAEAVLATHAASQVALQTATGPEGRTYTADPVIAKSLDSYYGREEYAAQQLATGWLARYLSKVAPPLAIDRGLVPLPVAPTAPPIPGPNTPQLSLQATIRQPLSP